MAINEYNNRSKMKFAILSPSKDNIGKKLSKPHNNSKPIKDATMAKIIFRAFIV
ncbi:MAG: hypothetical protein Q4F45_04650 [Alistipes sp.]|nr:hypothetical protein [Alistipes sp.]